MQDPVLILPLPPIDPVLRAAEEPYRARRKATHNWVVSQPEYVEVYATYRALVDAAHDLTLLKPKIPEVGTPEIEAAVEEALTYHVKLLKSDVRGQCLYEALTQCYDLAVHAYAVRTSHGVGLAVKDMRTLTEADVDREWVAREARRLFEEHIRTPVTGADLQIVATALGNVISQFEAVTKDEDLDLDAEDVAVVAYCKRVLAAAEAGDLSPIHRELAEDDAREAAAQAKERT